MGNKIESEIILPCNTEYVVTGPEIKNNIIQIYIIILKYADKTLEFDNSKILALPFTDIILNNNDRNPIFCNSVKLKSLIPDIILNNDNKEGELHKLSFRTLTIPDIILHKDNKNKVNSRKAISSFPDIIFSNDDKTVYLIIHIKENLHSIML